MVKEIHSLAAMPERQYGGLGSFNGGCFLMMSRVFRGAVLAFAASCSLVAAVPAEAGSIKREDFTFPEAEQLKIAVFRPDVRVGSMRIGGMDEPNAEWTDKARVNLQAELQTRAKDMKAQVTFVDELEGEHAALLQEYRGLFETVAGSVFRHHTMGDTLATKQNVVREPAAGGKVRERKINRLDWTLGPGAAQLKAATGADYAMFFFTHDAYGDAGRKVAQVLMAGLFGAYVPAGIHVGYAGLVDLTSGDIVWFNTDLAMGGDPREPDGAAKRVGQLMEGFPMRDGVAASGK
jgi:hypothetical protein